MKAASRLSGLGIALAAVAVLGAGRPAGADVSFTEKVRFGDAGGLGRSHITRYVTLSGLKEREESVAKMVDAPGYPPGINEKTDLRIFRLDRDLVWTLDPKSKTYTEATTEQVRAQTSAVTGQAPPDQMREAPDAKVDLTLKKMNIYKTVGPWQTEGMILTVRTEEQDTASGKKRPAAFTCELWIAQGVPGQAEIREFAQAYMDKLQATSGMAGMQLMAAAFPKSFGRAFEAIKGIPGTPVEWTWTVRRALTGKEAADLREDVSVLEEGGEDQLADEQRHGEHDTNDPHNLQTPSPDPPVKRANRFDAAKGGSEAAAELAGVSPDEPKGIRLVMKVTTVLDKIEAVPASPRLFEIPAGYTKVEVSQ